MIPMTPHWTYEIVTPNATEKDVSQRRRVHGPVPSRLPEPDYALQPYPDLSFDQNELYGSIDHFVDLCFETYRDPAHKAGTLGVLSVGKPGSGKTTFLNVLSQRAREEMGLITVMIRQPLHGPKFNSFIRDLPACVIGIDEWEKTYQVWLQEKLLTLYSGVDTSPLERKKLIVHTANDENMVHRAFLNRPGRIFFKFKHGGVDADFIRNYCAAELKQIHWVNEIINFSKTFDFFSFDKLKATVEQVNRRNEPPRRATQFLNMEPLQDAPYAVSVFVDQKQVAEKRIQGGKVMESQLMGGELKIAWMKEDMTGIENMVEIDPASEKFTSAGGDFSFEVPEKNILVMFDRIRRHEVNHVTISEDDMDRKKVYRGHPNHAIPF